MVLLFLFWTYQTTSLCIWFLCWWNIVLNFPVFLPEACLQVFSSGKTWAPQVLCSRTYQKRVSLCQGLSYPFQFGQASKVCQCKNVYPSLALSNSLLLYSLKNTPLDSNHKKPIIPNLSEQQKLYFCFLQHHTEKLCCFHLVVSPSFTKMTFVASIPCYPPSNLRTISKTSSQEQLEVEPFQLGSLQLGNAGTMWKWLWVWLETTKKILSPEWESPTSGAADHVLIRSA